MPELLSGLQSQSTGALFRPSILQSPSTGTDTDSAGFCGKLPKRAGKLCLLLVNPKFKVFSRPILIAVLVGAATLTIFVVLFMSMLGDCAKNTITGSPTFLADLYSSGKIGCIDRLRKINYIYRLRITNCFFAPATVNGFVTDLYGAPHEWGCDFNEFGSNCTYERMRWEFFDEWIRDYYNSSVTGLSLPGAPDHTGWSGRMVPNRDRRPELMPLRNKEIFCEGSANRADFYGEGRSGMEESFPEEFVSWEERVQAPWLLTPDFAPPWTRWSQNWLWDDQCDLQTYNWVDGGVYWDHNEVAPQIPIAGFPECCYPNPNIEETILIAEYSSCPGTTATLGSAFGWATAIELMASAVIIGCLVGIGYVKIVKKDSDSDNEIDPEALREMVQEIVQRELAGGMPTTAGGAQPPGEGLAQMSKSVSELTRQPSSGYEESSVKHVVEDGLAQMSQSVVELAVLPAAGDPGRPSHESGDPPAHPGPVAQFGESRGTPATSEEGERVPPQNGNVTTSLIDEQTAPNPPAPDPTAERATEPQETGLQKRGEDLLEKSSETALREPDKFETAPAAGRGKTAASSPPRHNRGTSLDADVLDINETIFL